MSSTLFKRLGIFALLVVFVLAMTACDPVVKVFEVTFFVIDEAEEPIEGAAVELEDVGTENTGENGSVQFTEVAKGNYDYTVTKEGFEDFTGSVQVINEDVTVEVEMLVETEPPVPDGEMTGILERVYEGGESVKISGVVYEVVASPGLQRYFAQLDSKVYGVAITVELENGEIASLLKVELENTTYDEIAFSSLVNPTYPVEIDYVARVRDVEFVGQPGTQVVQSVSNQSKIDGIEVEVAMDRVVIKDLEFDIDVQVTSRYPEIENCSVEGDLDIIGHGGTFALTTLTGDLTVTVDGQGTTLTADEIEGNVTTNAETTLTADVIEGNVTTNAETTLTAGEIEGNVNINAETTLAVETIDGNLTVNAASTLDISEVTGNVTLNAAVDLTGVEIGGSVIVGAAGIEVSGVQSDGTLRITANNVTVKDSEFGELAGNNNGTGALLENVVFAAVHEDLTGNGDLIDGITVALFTVDLDGWQFNNVTWPVDDDEEKLEFDVVVDAEEVGFEDKEFTGTLVVAANADDAFFIGCAFPDDVTLNGVDAYFEDFTIEGVLDINAAAEFSDGVVAGDTAGVNTIAAGTMFTDVTFDFVGVIDVIEDEIVFNGCSFLDQVDVIVAFAAVDAEVEFVACTFDDDATLTLDVGPVDCVVSVEDIAFAGESEFTVAATNNADVTIDGANFGGEVDITLQGAGELTVDEAVIEYDEDNPGALLLDDANLTIRFNNGAIYRQVDVNDVTTARFFDTKLYSDLTVAVAAGDVRLNRVEFVAEDDDITVTADLDTLYFNSVKFFGPEDVTIVGNGVVKFLGTIQGNDALTVDNTNLDVDFEHQVVIQDSVFEAAINDTVTDEVNDKVQFVGVTFENGVIATADELKFEGVEVTGNLTVTGDDAVLTDVEVTGDLTINGADVALTDVEVGGVLAVTGADAVLNGVDVTGNANIDGADAELEDVTVDGSLNIPQAGAVLTDVEVGVNLGIGPFDGEITLANVDVTANVGVGNTTNTEDFTLTWAGGEVEGTIVFNIDIDTTQAEGTVAFTDVDFNNITVTNADVLSFTNGTVAGAVGVTAVNELTFNGLTFEAVQAIDFAAEFEGNTFDDDVNITGASTFDGDTFKADLTVNNAAAILENAVLDTAGVVTITDGDEVAFVGGTLKTGGNINVVAVNAISFTGVTFEIDMVVGGVATFEGNYFEGTATINAGSTFDGDTFKDNVTIDTGAATFANLIIEAGAANLDVNVNETIAIDGMTFVETGVGTITVTVAGNRTLILQGVIDWTDAPDLEIDASAPGANVDDDDATWVPEPVVITGF